jgi:hypothetical protein
MNIERILKDPGGTTVALPDGTEYHFKPAAPGAPHIANVHEAHVRLFLAHPEAYRLVEGQSAPAAPVEPNPAPAPSAPPPAQTVAADQQALGSAPAAPVEPPAPAGDLSALSDDDLRVEFERSVGRKPSPRAGRDTMISQIETARTSAPPPAQ